MQRPPFRRRRLWVDAGFQRSVCLHAIGLGLLVLVSITFGIFAPLLLHLGEPGIDLPAEGEAAIVMVYMHERFWGVAVGCLALVCYGALRLSHRIAGPLVRYKRNLRQLADGRLPSPLVTRRRDYLKEEVACLNAAVDGVRQRLAAIRAAELAARRQLVALVDRRQPIDTAELQVVLTAQREVGVALDAFTETGDLDAVPVATAGRLVAFATGTGVGNEA